MHASRNTIVTYKYNTSVLLFKITKQNNNIFILNIQQKITTLHCAEMYFKMCVLFLVYLGLIYSFIVQVESYALEFSFHKFCKEKYIKLS